MRNIILDLAVSLDGLIEGPNGETDWCIMEDDMDFPGFLSRRKKIVLNFY
jgi:dihydrofolate reductase